MPSIMEPPKFITCPDCGDRYDNERKRRLIDTCGHPRCYSCLFVDKPCPLCSKIPQARSPTNSDLHEVHLMDESTDKNSSLKTSKGLSKKPFTGSHPNLSDIRKARSATLPHSGFRTDSYFRSLYRYDPHSSQEYVNSLNVKPRTQGLQNYHKSLENLTEQFWQSVERAGGTRSTSPSNSDDVSSNEGTRPAPVVSARPRSQTALLRDTRSENRRSLPLRDEAVQTLRVEVLETGRSRSHSDLQSNISNDLKERAESHHYERARRDERGRSFSPTQSTQSLSDRSSDVSIPLSDSWSESSGDSDHVMPCSPTPTLPKRWSYEESQMEMHKRNGQFPHHSEREIRSKKIAKNPFEGVIYWVVDPPKKSPDVKRSAPSAQEVSGSRNEHLACADDNNLVWSSEQFKNPNVTSL